MSFNQKHCALCSTLITVGNDSAEHIIPNAIGGMKKVSGFICRICNSRSGSDGDAELAKQLNWWCLTVGIKRERGYPPAMEINRVNGEPLLMNSDGSLALKKPTFKTEQVGEKNVRISFTARNMAEAEKILAGLKNKYPRINVDEIKRTLKIEESEPPLLLINPQFGGDAANRSVVKTACAMAAHHGLNVIDYKLSAQFLRRESTSPTVNMFYERDLVKNRPIDDLFHCVSIQSDVKRGLLLAYVEYFGWHRMIVLLSENYIGNNVNVTYAINPSLGQEIKLDVDLNLSDEELQRNKYGARPEAASCQAAMAYAVPIALQRSNNLAYDNALKKAWVKVGHDMKLSPGQLITPDIRPEFITRLVEEMSDYISRIVRRP